MATILPETQGTFSYTRSVLGGAMALALGLISYNAIAQAQMAETGATYKVSASSSSNASAKDWLFIGGGNSVQAQQSGLSLPAPVGPVQQSEIVARPSYIIPADTASVSAGNVDPGFVPTPAPPFYGDPGSNIPGVHVPAGSVPAQHGGLRGSVPVWPGQDGAPAQPQIASPSFPAPQPAMGAPHINPGSNYLPQVMPTAAPSSLETASVTPYYQGGDLVYLKAQGSDKVGLTPDKMQVVLGAGLMWEPDYKGSDDYELDWLPLIDIEYNELVYLSSIRGLGLKFMNFEIAEGSAYVDWRRERKHKGTDLEDFEDLSGSVAVGLAGALKFDPVRIEARVDRGFTGDIRGLRGQIDAVFSTYLSDSFGFKSWAGLTAADSTYLNALYSVTKDNCPSCITKSTLDAYTLDGGLEDAHLGAAFTYFFTPNVSLTASLEGMALLGEVANSPIVADLGTEYAWRAALSAAYRF